MIPWERMQKLLALAEGTEHPGEERNARSRLEDLMRQHQVTIEEVQDGRRHPKIGTQEWLNEAARKFMDSSVLTAAFKKMSDMARDCQRTRSGLADVLRRLDDPEDETPLERLVRPLVAASQRQNDAQQDMMEMFLVLLAGQGLSKAGDEICRTNRRTQSPEQQHFANMMRQAANSTSSMGGGTGSWGFFGR